MTLDEVIEGLQNGKSFKRVFKDGVEYVRPIENGMVVHVVADPDGGGAAALDLSVLDNGRWAYCGWEEE